jgi:hypothetical protein
MLRPMISCMSDLDVLQQGGRERLSKVLAGGPDCLGHVRGLQVRVKIRRVRR